MDESNGNTVDECTRNGKIKSVHSLKFLLTNARSLLPKIHSLHTAFKEHQLDFALITESWLKDGAVLNRDIIDLEWGTNLKIVYKNRPKNSAGLRKVGGGVSIIYDKSKCSLKERKIKGNKFELVLAVGRVGKIPRQVAIFCAYLEPRMKAEELADLCEMVAGEIILMKARSNPLIVLGGDLNRKSIETAIDNFPDIVQANSEPTRGDACLDIVYSDAQLTPVNWPPLETPEGVRSDHDCVVFSGSVIREKDFVWLKKTTRKHTDAALELYGQRLREADWDSILPPRLGPDELVDRFQSWAGSLTDELFPVKTVRYRSNEAPWITDGVRRISRKKRRVYKREGKSRLWHTLQERQDLMIADSQSAFVDNIATHGTSTKKYFTAVKAIGRAAPEAEWKLTDLFPGSSEMQAGEEAAAYFTKITDLFRPLRPPETRPDELRAPVTVAEVAAKLKAAKKPNSSVDGDLLPRVVKAHHPLLAEPVSRIFNAVFRTGSWPSAWKTETTVVIPKVAAPESLADCRNISCTPFLSKVLESILLEDMRKEIPEDLVQYGGIKASSVDHLLVDLFDQVLEPLEAGSPSLILGVDFEKAFNRLDHNECLDQLAKLGAGKATLALTRSFLTGRSMRVRVGKELSSGRALRGGSPQGSILGCYLYCAATQHIGLGIRRANRPAPRPPSLLPATVGASDDDSDTDDDGFGLMERGAFGTGRGDSDDSFHTAASNLSASSQRSLEERVLELMGCFKYVDDTTATETVKADQCIRHVTGASPTEEVPAMELESFLNSLVQAVEKIGMKVNCKKTQLLCISPDNGYKSLSTIHAGGETIRSQDTMKLLGFVVGTAPGVTDQVLHIKAKFRARFWTLIHMRRAGIKGTRLFKLYSILVRPILETNCVIYHPMLTRGQSKDLERLQKHVVRLCFGTDGSYSETCEAHGVLTLEARRITRLRRFVAKAMTNPWFASKWFRRRQEIGTEIRNRRPFIENRARTERYMKSPLVQMQRIANDLITNAI